MQDDDDDDDNDETPTQTIEDDDESAGIDAQIEQEVKLPLFYFLTLAGYCVDGAIILTSLADSASKYFLAAKLILCDSDGGHEVWGWIVVAILVISALVKAWMFAWFSYIFEERSAFVFIYNYVAAFLFAPFSSLWHYIRMLRSSSVQAKMERVWRSWALTSIMVRNLRDRPGLREEMDAAFSSLFFMGRIDGALTVQPQTHNLYIFEWIMESLPLLVVTILIAQSSTGDDPSLKNALIFSLVCSIASVLAKGHVVVFASRLIFVGFSLPVLFFKWFLGAHDLFSALYILSVVFQQKLNFYEDKTHFWIAVIWFAKSGLMMIVMIIDSAVEMYTVFPDALCLTRVVMVVSYLPSLLWRLLLHEVLKLTIVPCFLRRLELQLTFGLLPVAAVLFTFVQQKSSRARELSRVLPSAPEYLLRLAHIYRCFWEKTRRRRSYLDITDYSMFSCPVLLEFMDAALLYRKVQKEMGENEGIESHEQKPLFCSGNDNFHYGTSDSQTEDVRLYLFVNYEKNASLQPLVQDFDFSCCSSIRNYEIDRFRHFLTLNENAKLLDEIERSEDALRQQFHQREYEVEFSALVKKGRVEKVYSFWRMFGISERSNGTFSLPFDDVREKSQAVFFIAHGFNAAVGLLLYLFAFIFLSSTHTTLQLTLFYIAIAGFVIAFALLPNFFAYYRFCTEMSPMLYAMNFHEGEAKRALQWIELYHRPHDNELLAALIPNELIPHDVLPLISSFLIVDDIELGGLSIEELAEFYSDFAHRGDA